MEFGFRVNITCLIRKFVESTILTVKNTTRCNSVSKFIVPYLKWSSTCFGRHTANHQEPKTALAASSFAYVEGWWTCGWWTLSGSAVVGHPTTFHVCKTRGYFCSFSLLIMGGVSPETCWASFQIRSNKFWYTVASCWVFHCKNCSSMRIQRVWCKKSSS